MRRDSQTGVWGRAVRARQNPVAGRYLRREADFELGHHGFSPVRRYAWAVVDVNSRYAVGGPAVSQLPLASWGLFALGGALLGATWWEARRRR
jgi:hypothetical protein